MPLTAPAPAVAHDDSVLRKLASDSGVIPAMERLLAWRDQQRPSSNPRYWAIVNFDLHSAKPRLFLFDRVDTDTTAYLCAHGKGSEGPTDDGYAAVFGNEPGSNCSSLGVYQCGELYDGKHGKSMRLDGLESTNSNACDRFIVMHGADYVSPETIASSGRIGRSDGCPALELSKTREVVEALHGGSLMLLWKTPCARRRTPGRRGGVATFRRRVSVRSACRAHHNRPGALQKEVSMSLSFRQISCAVAALTTAVSPLSAAVASAQDYPPPPQQGYRDPPPPPQDYRDAPPPQDYRDAPPPGNYDAPPPGYDGSRPPPPPPGYQADPAYDGDRTADQRYEAYAEDWAQRYCVKSHGNTAAGAVIGGLFGALLGSSIAGRHDRGAGAFVGGVAGAAGGAAIASADGNATSPGCPPGYVVARDAPAFYYGADAGPYYYAAPGWYRPWVFYGGRWTYRPYPYHGWYYRHYHGGPRPYYRGGYRHRHY